MTVGALEILLVLAVVLLLIGPRRIADLGRSLGRGVRDFRGELRAKQGEKDGELQSGEHRKEPEREER